MELSQSFSIGYVDHNLPGNMWIHTEARGSRINNLTDAMIMITFGISAKQGRISMPITGTCVLEK